MSSEPPRVVMSDLQKWWVEAHDCDLNKSESFKRSLLNSGSTVGELSYRAPFGTISSLFEI